MNHLIIGFGEVGSSLSKIILKAGHSFVSIDPEKGLSLPGEQVFDVMHITFPYSENFVESVKWYLDSFSFNTCIIHSTVKVGTCDLIKDQRVSYSYVTGRHPEMEKEMLAFRKQVASPYKPARNQAILALNAIGFTCDEHDSYREVELMKHVDTAYYGVCIAFHKFIGRASEEKYGVSAKKVVKATEIYNEGYKSLGFEQFVRPVLEPTQGKIGGHCVVPNAQMLLEDFPDESILKAIVEAE